MEAYSQDLRERVMAAYDEGGKTLKQVAGLFKVSVAWINKLRLQRRETGSIAVRPGGRGPEPKLDEAGCQRLAKLVREDPDATLEELRNRLDIDVSRATICRALARLCLTFKKSRYMPANVTARTSWSSAKNSVEK